MKFEFLVSVWHMFMVFAVQFKLFVAFLICDCDCYMMKILLCIVNIDIYFEIIFVVN